MLYKWLLLIWSHFWYIVCCNSSFISFLYIFQKPFTNHSQLSFVVSISIIIVLVRLNKSSSSFLYNYKFQLYFLLGSLHIHYNNCQDESYSIVRQLISNMHIATAHARRKRGNFRLSPISRLLMFTDINFSHFCLLSIILVTMLVFKTFPQSPQCTTNLKYSSSLLKMPHFEHQSQILITMNKTKVSIFNICCNLKYMIPFCCYYLRSGDNNSFLCQNYEI